MNSCCRHHILRLLPILAVVAGAATAPTPASGGPDHAHDAVSCRGCHRDAGQPAAGQRLDLQGRCVACHADALAAGPAPSFHGRGRCLDCHAFHAAGTVTTAAGTLDLAALAGVDRAHCRSCHDGKGRLEDLSDAHRVAGRLYHEHADRLRGQSGSTPCLWCHSTSRRTEWQAVPAADRIAFEEHASHPFGIAVRPGRGPAVRRMRGTIDPRIPLPAGRLECVSCHQLTADTKNRLIPFARPKDLCLGCHELQDNAGGAEVLVAGLGTP